MNIEFLEDVTIDGSAENLLYYSFKSSNTNTHYRKLGFLD